MTSGTCRTGMAIGLSVTLMLNSLIGCGETNLSGYRPAKEHDAPSPEDPAVLTQESPPDSTQTAAGLEATLTPSEEEDDALPVSALGPVNVVSSVRSLLNIPPSDTKVREEFTAANPTTPQVGAGQVGAGQVGTGNTGSTASLPNQIELLIKEKKFQTEPKTGALRVSFDDLDLLKVLNMEPVVENADELMPDWLKGLDGKTIRIRGFMYPTYETEGIERFVLARDNQICCFGRDPKIYDLVQVDMKSGKTTNYIPATRAFDVVGTFRIKMLADEGKPYGLYLIEQAAVIDR